MEKNLYVFRLCSFLDFNNLNIEQDNYYTHTSTKERLFESREWFLPLKIFLINEFVPSANCRLVTNFISGVQRVFGVVVGDGAAQVGIFGIFQAGIFGIFQVGISGIFQVG